MTQKELGEVVYVPNYYTNTVDSMTYEEYLDEHGKDLCTSPRGVCERLHIREVEEDEDIEYQIWSWGVGGNNLHFSEYSFDNPVDAKLHIYKRKEWYSQESNWDAPQYYNTYKEAERVLQGEGR